MKSKACESAWLEYLGDDEPTECDRSNQLAFKAGWLARKRTDFRYARDRMHRVEELIRLWTANGDEVDALYAAKLRLTLYGTEEEKKR